MQTNTQVGRVVFPAKGDLTGKEDYLVELISDSTVAKVQLPDANTDYAIYVVTDGDADGKDVTVAPLSTSANFRVKAKGTGSAGDVLVLADIGTAADKGKVRKLPASAGTYRGLGIAEEDFVDGQTVLMRPFSIGNIVVP